MSQIFQSELLPDYLKQAVAQMDITEPTDIQQKMIPEALEGQSIIARSQTGTGKTLAYLLPALARVEQAQPGLQTIILAPTQELSMQIYDVAKQLVSEQPIHVASFIGGANIKRQLEKLKKQKPQVVIGTPGRLLELVELKKLKLKDVKTVIVDEADRMFGEASSWKPVTEIAKRTGREKQFLFVSATIPPDLAEKTADFAPFMIELLAEGNVINIENVSHFYIESEARDKIDTVRKLIHAESIQKGVVFVNQLDRLAETTEKLKFRGIKAASLSSDSNKIEREKTLKAFRSAEVHVLVATDLAARGLDVSDVTHIIQLDAPKDSASYLHRAGRTGRAGKTGQVFTLLEPNQAYKLNQLDKELEITLSQAILKQGNVIKL